MYQHREPEDRWNCSDSSNFLWPHRLFSNLVSLQHAATCALFMSLSVTKCNYRELSFCLLSATFLMCREKKRWIQRPPSPPPPPPQIRTSFDFGVIARSCSCQLQSARGDVTRMQKSRFPPPLRNLILLRLRLEWSEHSLACFACYREE